MRAVNVSCLFGIGVLACLFLSSAIGIAHAADGSVLGDKIPQDMLASVVAKYVP